MPTLPPNRPAEPPTQPRADVPEPHKVREVAESFGLDAQRYDRTRPRYPQALIDRIVATSIGVEFLDVGIGTGIAARQLAAEGRDVFGVEPDVRMAEFARQEGFEVEVAKFEEWDDAGRTFDAVVAAQAWHWVDPVRGAAKAARVLRTGGRLTVFWNAYELPPELAEAITNVYRRVLPDSPLATIKQPIDRYLAILTTVSDGMRTAGGFGEPERWRFDWEQRYGRDEFLDQIPTLGGQGQLPPATLSALLAGVSDAIDAVGGGFTMKYAAMAVTAVRIEK